MTYSMAVHWVKMSVVLIGLASKNRKVLRVVSSRC